MSTQEIIEELPRLSLEEREKVARALQELTTVNTSEAPESSGRRRIAGLHEGTGYFIADDFDDPLPDSFWLGEEA